MRCSNCGSRSTQAQLDQFQCVDCGSTTMFDGSPGYAGQSPSTKDALLERVGKDHSPNLVGNMADLQRLGGAKAGDRKADEFVLPSGVSGDEVTSTRSGGKGK